MRLLSKPVWHEGMHLTQHHFQTQAKYFEDSIAFAITQLFFKPYGVAGLELDVDSLKNGTVSLVHGRGTMPDGLTFNMPEGDPRPDAKDIGDLFSPTDQSHLVHLTIPSYRAGAKNCTLASEPDHLAVRYRGRQDSVSDDTSGADPNEILIGTKNFRLLLDSELESGLVSLPIARIVRDASGVFAFDARFIPPCLQIGASGRIMQILARLIDVLDAKISKRPDSPVGGSAQYSFGDIESYWKSHAIRASLAPLRNYLQLKRTAPETLYVELSRLAGALATFDLESSADVATIPLYDHDDLETGFTALDKRLRDSLSKDDSRDRCVRLKIRSAPPPYEAIRGCSIKDNRCMHRKAEWYVGIRSPAQLAEVARIVEKSLKVGSANTIVHLVNEARPGASLEYVQTPPAVLSPKAGWAYFRLARTGKAWDSIAKEESIAVYVPRRLAEPEVEVVVVLPQSQE